MTRFKINLIRGQVPSFEERNEMYWRMHLYIFVTGIMLVIVAYKATKDIMACQYTMQGAAIYEQQFMDKYPGQGKMPDYLKKLSGDLKKKTDLMNNMNAIMEDRRLLSPILSGIAMPLEQEMRVSRVFSDEGMNKVEFEIACYRKDVASHVDMSAIIKIWQADPVMMKATKEIKPALVQRQIMGGRDAVLLKFIATPKPGAN